MFEALGLRPSADDGVDIDLGAGAARVSPRLRYLDLTGKGAIPVPAEGPVDWAQLAKLAECGGIEWDGPERGVIEAIRVHWISGLTWHNADGDVDLARTRVTGVRIGGAGLRSLTLPVSTEDLRLDDPPPDLRVEAPDLTGAQVFCEHSEKVTIPEGLHGIRKLWLRTGERFCFSVLDRLTALEELRVELRSPGSLSGLDRLVRHQRLRLLEISNAYDWVPGELPELPSLRRLELDGTREAILVALKTRFAGSTVEVEAEGAMPDGWLAEHIDNPFRDWVEESEPFGAAACEAYNRAVAGVQAGDAEGALRGLAADLDALDEEYGLIDTMLREEAWEIFLELAESAGVPQELAEAWFDCA